MHAQCGKGDVVEPLREGSSRVCFPECGLGSVVELARFLLRHSNLLDAAVEGKIERIRREGINFPKATHQR